MIKHWWRTVWVYICKENFHINFFSQIIILHTAYASIRIYLLWVQLPSKTKHFAHLGVLFIYILHSLHDMFSIYGMPCGQEVCIISFTLFTAHGKYCWWSGRMCCIWEGGGSHGRPLIDREQAYSPGPLGTQTYQTQIYIWTLSAIICIIMQFFSLDLDLKHQRSGSLFSFLTLLSSYSWTL